MLFFYDMSSRDFLREKLNASPFFWSRLRALIFFSALGSRSSFRSVDSFLLAAALCFLFLVEMPDVDTSRTYAQWSAQRRTQNEVGVGEEVRVAEVLAVVVCKVRAWQLEAWSPAGASKKSGP